jgi:hypothetical protein
LKSITVHNMDPDLDRAIRQLAAKKNQSLNKTIKLLLQDSLNLLPKKKKEDFSEFCGVWSKEEYEEFEKAVEDLERIDEDLWK